MFAYLFLTFALRNKQQTANQPTNKQRRYPVTNQPTNKRKSKQPTNHPTNWATKQTEKKRKEKKKRSDSES